MTTLNWIPLGHVGDCAEKKFQWLQTQYTYNTLTAKVIYWKIVYASAGEGGGGDKACAGVNDSKDVGPIAGYSVNVNNHLSRLFGPWLSDSEQLLTNVIATFVTVNTVGGKCCTWLFTPLHAGTFFCMIVAVGDLHFPLTFSLAG